MQHTQRDTDLNREEKSKVLKIWSFLQTQKWLWNLNDHASLPGVILSGFNLRVSVHIPTYMKPEGHYGH